MPYLIIALIVVIILCTWINSRKFTDKIISVNTATKDIYEYCYYEKIDVFKEKKDTLVFLVKREYNNGRIKILTIETEL